MMSQASPTDEANARLRLSIIRIGFRNAARVISRGDGVQARAALSDGADPNLPNLHYQQGVTTSWKARNTDWHCIHEAALQGNIDVVAALIDAGADADTIGTYDLDPNNLLILCTPLKCAVAMGHANVVALLLATGAVPDRRFDYFAGGNGGEETLLDFAIGSWNGYGCQMYCHLKQRILSLLLRAGATARLTTRPGPNSDYYYTLPTSRPYISRVDAAGGFPEYERLQREKLVIITAKVLGRSLPPAVIPSVVKFWGHPGDY